jgi:hypothetical protein
MLWHRLFAAALLAAAITESPAQAHAPTDLGDEALEDLVRRAEFIFEGRVVEVDYRASDRRSEQDAVLPHTFVTYEIGSFVKGQSDARQVTLRFIGGPDQRGRYLTVTDVPLFEEGDHDVLFVRGNGERACPLVGCDEGRFQIRDQLVFDADGFPLFLNRQGAIRGVGQPDPRFLEHPLPPMAPEGLPRPTEFQGQLLERVPPEVRQQLVDDWARAARERPVLGTVLEEGAAADQERATEGLQRLELETFLDLIRDAVDRQQAGGIQPGTVQTVEIQEPFYFQLPEPVEPPAAAVEPLPGPEAPQTEQEKRELEMLREQQGDPVIRAR